MPVEEDPQLAQAKRRVGTVLRDKYTVERVLGVGGMACVYAATHRNKKRVAIKMLHPELSIHEDVRRRFLREGYVANSVGHKGAVDVIDDDVAEDGAAFLVMELLSGMPLDAVAARAGGTLAASTAIAAACELCAVLAAAHAQGVIHRDIKPANIFITSEGELKVLDFGIARLRDASMSAHATSTGVMMGTPAYMAPEQASGEMSAIGPGTDLWAVGAMLFVLLSGKTVHEGETAQQLVIRTATQPARSVQSVVPVLSPSIAAVIDRALTFRVAERWASAAEMRDALLRAHKSAIGPLDTARELRAAVSGNAAERVPVSSVSDPGVAEQHSPEPVRQSGATAVLGGAKPTPASAITETPLSQSLTGIVPTRSNGWLIAVAAVVVLALGGMATAKVVGGNEDTPTKAGAAVSAEIPMSGSLPVAAFAPVAVSASGAAVVAASAPSVAIAPSSSALVATAAPAVGAVGGSEVKPRGRVPGKLASAVASAPPATAAATGAVTPAVSRDIGSVR